MLYEYTLHPANLDRTPKRLTPQPTIHATSRLVHCKLGEWTDIGANCMLVESVVDDYSYLAGDAQVIYTTIGKFCSIASHVRINPGNHPMERVTQHHSTYRRVEYGFDDHDDAEFFEWRRRHHCTIGHDVWLGHGVVVMPGVTIGTGAVIGSGAVVTKDVEPYMITVGVPARPLRPRFDADTVQALLAMEWWNWDRATLEARFADMRDLPSLLAKWGGAPTNDGLTRGQRGD